MEKSLVSASELAKKELKKHIAAIRVSNTVGLLGRKMWNVLLLNAYENLLENKTHSIPVRVLSEVIGYDSKSYSSLDKALERLQTTLVTWDIGGGKEINGMWLDNFKRTQMMGGVSISEGIIEYKFDTDLAKLLYNPEIYQRIDISQQKLFKSSHSIALWENCLRYVGVGSTGFRELDEWRELLGGTGKAYNQFKIFRRAVLVPAIKEVNEVSNISVEMQTQKKGRKITHLCFLVSEKEQKNLFSDALQDMKSSAEYADMLKIGVHKVQAIKWLGDHSFPYVREKLNLLEKNQQKKLLDNPVGWLRKAIEEDYTDSEEQQKKEKKKLEEKRLAKEKAEAEKRRKEEREIDLSKAFADLKTAEFIKTMSAKEQEKFLEKTRKENPMMSDFIKSISDPYVKSQLVKIIPDYQEEKEKYIQENF